MGQARGLAVDGRVSGARGAFCPSVLPPLRVLPFLPESQRQHPQAAPYSSHPLSICLPSRSWKGSSDHTTALCPAFPWAPLLLGRSPHGCASPLWPCLLAHPPCALCSGVAGLLVVTVALCFSGCWAFPHTVAFAKEHFSPLLHLTPTHPSHLSAEA